jgi:cytochrome c553
MKRFSVVAVFVMFAGVAAFAQDAKKGEEAFTTLKCTTCHAVAGKGGKLAKALDSADVKAMSAADIKKWLTDPASMEAKLSPKPKMLMSTSTAFKNKSVKPADVDNLAAYIATLK